MSLRRDAAFVAIVLSLAGLGTASTLAVTTAQTVTDETQVEGSFASVKTVQTDEYISILVTKNPETTPEPEPGEPIVIVPGEGENGTIVVPPTNETEGGGNVTVIEPDGNITEIEDGNVTNIDNDTVVITPPDENVTETPGNVTVIDPEPQPEPLPPVSNETTGGEEPCQCPPTGEIPPVIIEPAPGQDVNVTEPAPPSNETTTEEPAPPTDNQTAEPDVPPQPEPEPAPADNQTAVEVPSEGNATINAPGSNITITDEPSVVEPTSINFGSLRIPMA